MRWTASTGAAIVDARGLLENGAELEGARSCCGLDTYSITQLDAHPVEPAAIEDHHLARREGLETYRSRYICVF
jgi:hypothetical protein